MTRSRSTASADVPGIPLDAVAFYRELETSNSRTWWAGQKDRYAVSVREPMAHPGDVLSEEFEHRLFRPHRDVRFSKDPCALSDNGFDIGGDVLATRPRGIPADHPRLELLRHRTLTASRDHGVPDWLEADEVVDRVREDWVAVRPLIEWCEQYVGATDQPRGR